jgi:hypothetical protein
MEIHPFKKGSLKALFKLRPHRQSSGHLLFCYLGLYTILQLQLVCARHHDLGKLLTNSNSNSNSNNNNNNNNDNKINNFPPSQQQLNQQLAQQKVNAAQILNDDDVQPILKQKPILDQKITPQLPSDINAPSGAVLSKDDGKYSSFFHTLFLMLYTQDNTITQTHTHNFYLNLKSSLYIR